MTDYCTLAELKTHLHIPDTDDDAALSLAITAASAAIDKAANRTFGVVGSAEARVYTATFDAERYCYSIAVDDFMTETGLAIAADPVLDGSFSETVDVADVRLYPFNAEQKGLPWTHLLTNVSVPRSEGRVRVTALWGWTAVPSAIKNACLLQAIRFFKRKDAPFGVAGSPEMGSELRLLAKLDPDVAVMVNAYSRKWGAA